MGSDACLVRVCLCLIFGPFGILCWPCVPDGQQQQQQQQQQVVIMSGYPPVASVAASSEPMSAKAGKQL